MKDIGAIFTQSIKSFSTFGKYRVCQMQCFANTSFGKYNVCQGYAACRNLYP